MLTLALALPLLFASPETAVPVPAIPEKVVIEANVSACTDDESGVSGRCLILTGERGEVVFFFSGQLRSIKVRFGTLTHTIWERMSLD